MITRPIPEVVIPWAASAAQGGVTTAGLSFNPVDSIRLQFDMNRLTGL
jgi:hypothetical protein